MDVSKDTISVAVLEPDRDDVTLDRVFNDAESVRRLVRRFDDPTKLWACYEAGPTGYDLHRVLTSLHVYQRWLDSLRLDDPALRATFVHYRATVIARDSALTAVEADLRPWCERDPFGAQVPRLAAYRGVTHLGALCLSAEVFDWRRFPRARPFMSFTGLVPSEDSTGQREHRGHITKAGNAHLRAQLVEAAWSYQHRPGVGVEIRRRQQGLSPDVVARAWHAQQRLSARFRSLAARKNVKSIVAAAIARELAGFLWAEMNADPA